MFLFGIKIKEQKGEESMMDLEFETLARIPECHSKSLRVRQKLFFL